MTRYQGRQKTQFDGGPRAKAGCTPTSLAMAALLVSAGQVNVTGSLVRALLQPREETNPVSPGWSLDDAKLAGLRLSPAIKLTVVLGTWAQVQARRAEGRAILLQGDSDQFTDGCSDAFEGDHCVCLPPEPPTRYGDPICRPAGPWQSVPEATLRRYAEKFGGGKVRFAFTDPVPIIAPDTGTEAPMQSFTFLPATTSGTLTVSETGHAYQRLLDGELHGPIVPGPAWTDRPAIGPVKLLAPIRGGKPGADRSTVYIVGDEAAALLVSDVTFTAGCELAIAAHDEKKRDALTAFVQEELYP